MPEVAYNPIPDVAPDPQTGNAKTNLDVPEGAFGSSIAQATDKLSQSISNIGQVWGQVQRDNAENTLYGAAEDQYNHLATLNGDDAVNAEGQIRKNIADATKAQRDSLWSPIQKAQFDNSTRLFLARLDGRITTHVEGERKTVMRAVSTASYANGLDSVEKEAALTGDAGGPGMDDAIHKTVDARTKMYQVEGQADQPEIVAQGQRKAQSDAIERWALTIEAGDPVKSGGHQGPEAAMRVIEAHKELLLSAGTYQQIHDRLENKANDDQATQTVNVALTGAAATRTAGGGGSLVHHAVAEGGPDQPTTTLAGLSAYLARAAQIESRNGADPNARGNIWQFMGATATKYGYHPGMSRADQEAAVKRLTADNRGVLVSGLGREPTGAELYLAHQQGAGGALKLMENPSRRAGDIVGDAAIRGNGGDPNAPAGQFVALWAARFNGTKAPVFTDTGTYTPTGKPTPPSTTPAPPFTEPPPPGATAAAEPVTPAPTPVAYDPDVKAPSQSVDEDLPGLAKARADQAAMLAVAAQNILMDPNISDAVKNKAILKLEAIGKAAAFAEGATAQQRKAVEDEKVHNIMGMIRGGDFAGAWDALTNEAEKGTISEERFRSMSAYITSITGKEHPQSYGPELQKYIDGIMAEPGDPKRIKDEDEILKAYQLFVDSGGKKGLSKTGVDEAYKLFKEHQKGEDEGVNMNINASLKVAADYFTRGENAGTTIGGVTIGGFKNPNAATYIAEYTARMMAEKLGYQKDHPNMEGFAYFDTKKRLAIMQEIASPQRLLRDQMDALNVQEPPIQEPELNAPPPNIDKPHWDDWLVSSLPVVADKHAEAAGRGGQSYMDPAIWADAVKLLLANAHNPAALQEFNGKPYGHAAGNDAKKIIDEFKEASGVVPPAEPRAPPRTRTPDPRSPPIQPVKPLVRGPILRPEVKDILTRDLTPKIVPNEEIPPEQRQLYPELNQ